MDKNRILLVDGHHLLFQMFYGMPSRIPSRDGKDIRAVIGFVGAIIRLIRMTSPTHLAVIFDSQTHNPRCDLMADYKANRPDFSELDEDENPFFSLPYIYDALDYMSIKHAEAVGCECDDIIATYALNLGGQNEVVISSHDSDYFQLITKSVKIVRYRGDDSVLCDEDYVVRKFSTRPSLYADSKSLFGDSADNVPGIRGIGPKTAATLVNKYGGIEKIYSDTSVIEEERLRKMLEENREIVLRNYSLIKLHGTSSVPFELDEMNLTAGSFKTMDVIRGLGLM